MRTLRVRVKNLAKMIAILLLGILFPGPVSGQTVLEAPPPYAETLTELGLRDRREEYLNASLEKRQQIAEQIGEDGARNYARQRGY